MEFDPLAAPEPDTSLGIEGRPIGGLGIALVRRLMDETEYGGERERTDRGCGGGSSRWTAEREPGAPDLPRAGIDVAAVLRPARSAEATSTTWWRRAAGSGCSWATLPSSGCGSWAWRAGSHDAEIGHQLGLSLFQHTGSRLQPLQLAVDAFQLGPGLLLLQVVVAVSPLDERFHLAPEEPQPRVAVHRSLSPVELASPDGLDDLVLRQPELLPRGLVAQRRALALPLGIQVVHRCLLRSSLRGTGHRQKRRLPALGDDAKAGEIDGAFVVHRFRERRGIGPFSQANEANSRGKGRSDLNRLIYRSHSTLSIMALGLLVLVLVSSSQAHRSMKEKARAEEHLRLLSLTDDLTGLYSRRGFLTLAEQQARVANRDKKPMVVISADLDALKEINDTFGHKEGDAAIAKPLTSSIGGATFLGTPGGVACVLASEARRCLRPCARD